MTKPTKLTLGIGAAGFVCGVLAGMAAPPLDWLLAWTAFSCFLAAGAYAMNRPDVLGKQAGRIGLVRALPVLPYLVAMRIACALIRRYRRYPPLSRVGDDLWIGGRFAPADLPPRAALVVDLTAESSVPSRLRVLPGYRSLPVLDGGIPPDELAVLALLEEIAATPGGVVVHCDSGVGRAPTFAALVLLRLGLAADVADALAQLRAGRPMARPTAVDRAFLERLAPRVIARAAGAEKQRTALARAVGS